jgi:formyltetrahydrofolate hydrolase
MSSYNNVAMNNDVKLVGNVFTVYMNCVFGKGAFASVVKATHKDQPGVIYACKVVEKKRLSRALDDHLKQEIKILQGIKH